MTDIIPLPQLTSHSINSFGAVLLNIRREENIHWYFGLKQAEIYHKSLSAALTETHLQMRKHAVEVAEIAQTLEDIDAQATPRTVAAANLQEATRELNEFKLAHSEATLLALRSQEKDILTELAVAAGERDRILNQYPQLQELTYDSIQSFTIEAQLCRESKYIAARAWACQAGLPEAVGVALFDVPQEFRSQVSAKEIEYRSQVLFLDRGMENVQAILQDLDPETRAKVLLNAAESVVRQSQLAGNLSE
ncbi:MAG: hypothetical protein KME11_05090 [Timaviella obliquedivisa GSE-PSE-MK23-08B]|jgi:hypothetical protein|nr:hypothetical protein [Timaviella obliquedivisa GSE-PSE-MK23-08B]